METDVRRNPALLKLDLYCRGMRIDDSCFIQEDGRRQILRTRAGLGSGLELILPGGLWTNVPVQERFTADSPYVLSDRPVSGSITMRSAASLRCACLPAPTGTTA